MRLPEIRAELNDLATRHCLPRLAVLAGEIGRRKASRGPRVSPSMTPALVALIRSMKAGGTYRTQQEIARALNINSGRVSEVLRGKRV